MFCHRGSDKRLGICGPLSASSGVDVVHFRLEPITPVESRKASSHRRSHLTDQLHRMTPRQLNNCSVDAFKATKATLS